MPLGTSLPTRLPTSSGGTQFYVNNSTGNDTTGDGSSGSPWKTINKAINSVTTAGTVINVADTTYTVSGFNPAINIVNKNISGAATNPITIKATNDGGVVITGPSAGGTRSYAIVVDNSTGWRIEGIKVSPFYGRDTLAGSDAVTIYRGHDIEFFNCIFEDIGGMAVLVKGESNTASTDIWFYGCIFRPTGNTSVTKSVGGGANLPDGDTDWACSVDVNDTGSPGYFDTKGSHFIYAGQYVTGVTAPEGVENFVVANCIFLGKTAGRHIQLGPQCRGAYIVNNTFYGNYPGTYYTRSSPSDDARYAGGGIEIFSDGNATVGTQDLFIVNNVFQHFSGHAVYGSGDVGQGTSNLVYNNLAYDINGGRFGGVSYQDDYTKPFEDDRAGSTLFVTTGGNLASSDPLFANPVASPSGDFTPLNNSPLYAASVAAYTPTIDFNGTTRDETNPTVGAIEQEVVGGGGGGGGGGSPARYVATRDGTGSRYSSPSSRVADLGGGGI